ncbi:hypothetical protein GC207_12245 [bacterium]|nr:hypothetical protein [bacterium]
MVVNQNLERVSEKFSNISFMILLDGISSAKHSDCELQNLMASATNPFTDARPRRTAVRCHSLLNWPRERLPQLWQRFINDIRGPAKPMCPDCGRPMILRKVKYGREAGKEFWDCSNYLRCSRKLDSDSAAGARLPKSPFSA